MPSFTDFSPREMWLLEAICNGELRQDDDHRLTQKDRRSLRRLYKQGYIGAEAVLWVDGPPHDKLFPTEETKDIVRSLMDFRAHLRSGRRL